VSREDALADQLKIDYTQAELTPRERAMLDFAHKLTLTPSAMRESDVQSLRAAGFDDLGILHVTLLAAWFNYINRVADGLGVTLEDGMAGIFSGHAPIPWEAESGSARPGKREDVPG
jgi:uncharacterized peroxidase-related enzyme